MSRCAATQSGVALNPGTGVAIGDFNEPGCDDVLPRGSSWRHLGVEWTNHARVTSWLTVDGGLALSRARFRDAIQRATTSRERSTALFQPVCDPAAPANLRTETDASAAKEAVA